MRTGLRRRAVRLLAAALAAVSLRAPAAAQMRASPARAWTPPFVPASPALLGGLQALLATPSGLKLTSEIPSFSAVSLLSPGSDTDLRVVGALSAHLPADFDARLAAALQRAQRDPEALASLTRTLGGAYRAAVPAVAESVGSRARQVVASVAFDQMDGRQLVAASRQLDRFGLYGPAVQEKSAVVRRLASQQLMENAQRIASELLRSQRAAEDSASTRQDAPSAAGGGKKIPLSWTLRPHDRTAAGKGAAGPRLPPRPGAPAEPKAKPMSADLYERLGAERGMTAAQVEAAYRQAADVHRPERYVDRDTRSILALVMAHAKIEEAFAVLRDPQRRAEYDRGATPKGRPAPNPLSKDFYERLGATPDMSPADIKSAYRRAAAAFHPDKARTNDKALVAAMTKAFQDIGDAYATLGDPDKRAAYDRARPSRR